MILFSPTFPSRLYAHQDFINYWGRLLVLQHFHGLEAWKIQILDCGKQQRRDCAHQRTGFRMTTGYGARYSGKPYFATFRYDGRKSK
jgi:hypothetical protein